MTSDASLPLPFFLDEVRAEISQGDVFDLTPSAYVRAPVEVLTEKRWIKGGIQGWIPEPWPLDEYVENVNATVTMTNARAMLVSHDCEIDAEDHRYFLFVMLRALARLPDAHQALVRGNQDYRLFHVPAHGALPESYADFRRLTTAGPAFIAATRRMASLSDVGRAAMCAHMISFFTRRMLKPE